MAKFLLYKTFYEHLITDAFTRHELHSYASNEKVFFERNFAQLISKKDFLKESFKRKLWELDLQRFDFLYNLTSTDENFGPKLYKYCKSVALDGLVSYDTVC